VDYVSHPPVLSLSAPGRGPYQAGFEAQSPDTQRGWSPSQGAPWLARKGASHTGGWLLERRVTAVY